MFLDPLAAKTVLSSDLNITLIPLGIQRKFSAFPKILKRLQLTKKTPEVIFVKRLLSTLHHLQKTHPRYKHMVYNPFLICPEVFLRIATYKLISFVRCYKNLSIVTFQDIFVGEILGAVILASDYSVLKSTFDVKKIKVSATGYESVDGQIIIDEKQGKSVKVLKNVDHLGYYNVFANRLSDEKQSAVVGSFNRQTRL
uniref:Inosine-uridine preferring nucleoside hydrolase n=1 Tax=Solanum tuberosum TaxID=4113 RepID=M0ZZP5_SOLTU